MWTARRRLRPSSLPGREPASEGTPHAARHGAVPRRAGRARERHDIVTNGDGPNTGFNDPTPRSPVGGNTGTTLGAQRLIVFQKAAEIWGQALDSDVPISIIAHFQPLDCTSTGAVLGSAGPTNFFSSDDPTLDAGSADLLPKAKTWYVSAETQRLAGVQILPGTGQDPNDYDILANFNSSLDTPETANCGGLFWYYGLDDQHGNGQDLLTVVLHEFGHGLGFLSLANPRPVRSRR